MIRIFTFYKINIFNYRINGPRFAALDRHSHGRKWCEIPAHVLDLWNGWACEGYQSRSLSMDKNPDPFRPAASSLPGDARLRVLIVEDNDDIARLMTLLLQHCG